MKYFFLLSTFIFIICRPCLAQNSVPNIPPAVLSQYSGAYPVAEEPNWVVEGDSYIVMFKLGGKNHYLRYDKNGSVMEQQTQTEKNALPKKALKIIASKYGDYQLHSVYMYSKKNPSEYQEAFLKKVPSHYEVSLFKDHQSCMLYFSLKGKLLNRPENKMIRQM